MPAEIEIKLNIGAEALQKLLASPLVADKIIGGSEAVHHLETSYYDTPSFKLMHSGIAYRVRKNGSKYEATIKTEKESHGGFSSRNEYNVDLPDGKPVLQGFKEEGFDTDLEKLIAGEQLAVDRGKIISGITGNECAVNETELEIKSGTKEDLLAYAGQIANLVPVTPENRSKYERGMKLCGINLTKPVK